jgi:hypothetical protein
MKGRLGGGMCVVWVRFIYHLLPGFEGSGFARTNFFSHFGISYIPV